MRKTQDFINSLLEEYGGYNPDSASIVLSCVEAVVEDEKEIIADAKDNDARG